MAHGRLRAAGRLDQIARTHLVRLGGGDAAQQPQPGRIGQRGERASQGLGGLFVEHLVAYRGAAHDGVESRGLAHGGDCIEAGRSAEPSNSSGSEPVDTDSVRGVPPSRERPPFTTDERAALVGWLDLQRAIVHWKCDGLSNEVAHRSVLPTSPLMTVAGVISHLRWVENTWFEVLFLGRPATGPQFDELEDKEMMVEEVPIGQLLEEYERQCALSNEIVAAHSLDDVGKHPDYRSAGANLRWMLIHMVEETARHAGHLDVIRELLDGHKGYY